MTPQCDKAPPGANAPGGNGAGAGRKNSSPTVAIFPEESKPVRKVSNTAPKYPQNTATHHEERQRAPQQNSERLQTINAPRKKPTYLQFWNKFASEFTRAWNIVFAVCCFACRSDCFCRELKNEYRI